MLVEQNSCYFGCSNADNSILTSWIDSSVSAKYKVIKCRCGFVYLSPRPSKSQMSKYYNTDHYHPHLRGNGIIFYLYKIARIFTYRWKYKIMQSHFSDFNTHLDYGGGDGSFSDYLNKKGFNSFCYDEYYTESVSLDTINKKFDIITLWHSLEHVDNIDYVFDEIDKFLQSDGLLIIAVPNINALERDYFLDDWKAYDIPRHLYHFSPKTLNKILISKGFKVVRKKRMLLDTIYISILSKNRKIGYLKLLYVIPKCLIQVLIKGPDKSSSLLYVCKKNK